jgi:hypothetical protein
VDAAAGGTRRGSGDFFPRLFGYTRARVLCGFCADVALANAADPRHGCRCPIAGPLGYRPDDFECIISSRAQGGC